MLSFKSLSEKKTKVKINPKKEDVMEKAKTMKPEKGEDCHCDHTKNEKKKRKEDTDHTEGTPEVSTESINQEELAYDSQEEVSEESNQEIAETEKTLLTFDQLQHSKTLDEEQLQEFLKGLFGGGSKVPNTATPSPSQRAVSGLQNQARQGNLMGSGMISNTAQTMMNRRDQQAAMMKQLLGRSKGGKVKKKSYKESIQFFEDRAEDAKKSLDAVKKRQKVLDAHEKKTGKKLDINKSVEAREHKKNFPGAKRTGKKVKGAKETPAQTQDRRIRQASTRIATKGYTSKEKKEVDSMAKHASRFD